MIDIEEDDMPKITGAPDQIWLVYGEPDEDIDHGLCDEVSWSPDSVFGSDVRYVRADIHEQLQAENAELRAIAETLTGMADGAYCRFISNAQRAECLGEAHKMAHGKFGSAELQAHRKGSELLGRHRAYADAARLLRSALPTPPAQGDE